MFDIPPNQPKKGHSAISNRTDRFDSTKRAATSDGWEQGRDANKAEGTD
jgi:hypothetical protein